MNIHLTDSAVERILALNAKEGKPHQMLRVTVLGGGCSGFQYEIGFDETLHDSDIKFEKGGAVLVTDDVSLPFLNEAVIDFEKTMVRSAFKIKNPNAASGCGCGKSFSPRG